MQFLPTFWGEGGWEEQEALALLSKKGVGREGSIESQQKFDFFCYDIMPKTLQHVKNPNWFKQHAF